MSPRTRREDRSPDRGTLSVAIRRSDWERASLLLLIGVAETARRLPPGTIDDLLALLDARGGCDD
jgi:hypothetical protein